MTKPDQNKLRVLILLLIALGVTLYIGFRMNRKANPEVVQAQAPRPEAVPQVQGDARIRLDLLNKKDADDDVGKKNLFQYPAKPVPPPPPPQISQPVPPPPSTTQTPVISGPPLPPPPPPIPLRYIGFAYVEPNSKALIATLMDGQNHFNAVEGDVYQGRYRVARITDTSVEIEDLQIPRRQTFPLVKQQ